MPLRYNTLVPVLFLIHEALLICVFWYSLELYQRCGLNHLDRGKSPSFHGSFEFWEQEKVAGVQVRWIRWLRHDYCVVLGQKITDKQRCVSRCIIVMQKPWIVLPQIRGSFSYYFTQTAHNYKVIFLIVRTTFWQELTMTL